MNWDGIGEGIGQAAGWLLLAYAGLAAFGVAYNRFTTWAEKTGFIQPYTAFFVAAGCLVILLVMTPFIGIVNGLMIVGGFGCAGLPMIIGSMVRHHAEQVVHIQQMKQQARESNDNPK